MKILITGGAGFIGSNVTKKLLQRGDSVVCVDEFNDYYSPEIKQRNVAQFAENSNYTLYRGTITDYEFLKGIFEKEKIQRVVHAAARAGVRPSIENPFIYEDTNVKGTLNLLHLAKEFAIENFVLFSSSSVYGNSPKVPFCETDPVDNPISPLCGHQEGYGASGLHLSPFVRPQCQCGASLYCLWSRRQA